MVVAFSSHMNIMGPDSILKNNANNILVLSISKTRAGVSSLLKNKVNRKSNIIMHWTDKCKYNTSKQSVINTHIAHQNLTKNVLNCLQGMSH